MSLSEIFSLAGQTAQTASTGERPDADLFVGLLDGQAAAEPEGQFGIARRLQEQAQATDRLNRSSRHSILADTILPLVNPSLFGAKPATPLVNPGPGPGPQAKPDVPLINPGPQTDAKVTGPLINPGPGDAKPDQPLVLPGADEGKTQSPLVLPTDATTTSVLDSALQVMSAQGQVQSAGALAQAAQQAVTRAPEITPTAPAAEPVLSGDEAAVSAEPGADLSTLTADGAPAVAAAASAASAATTSAQPADVAQTATRPEAVEAQPVDNVANDPTQAEADLPGPSTAPAVASAAHEGAARADAVSLAGRLSFDSLAQVSAQIIRRLEMRTTRFDMELNPVELGRVDVRLDIDAEGRLAARLAFDNPAAATELRGRVEDLRRDLQQAGFQLADDAFSFTDRGNSGGGRDFEAERGNRLHARSAAVAEQIDAAVQPALRALTRLGLDVRV